MEGIMSMPSSKKLESIGDFINPLKDWDGP